MSSEYQPIACAAYDYLEIACMHHEPVRIELHDGSQIEATASNVRVSEHVEYFDVLCAGQAQSIRLDMIAAISSLAQPPRFQTVQISPPPDSLD